MPRPDVAVPIVFPDYLIEYDTPPVTVSIPDTLPWIDILPNRVQIPKTKTKVPYLGHAGILFIEGKTGLTEYFEYGRYDGPLGAVRKRTIPDVRMSKNERPSRASMEKTLGEISRVAGHGGRVTGAYIELPPGSFIKMRGYAMTRWKQNNNAHRVPYDLTSNSCLHFMKKTAEAGGAQLPDVYLGTPTAYMFQIQLQQPDLEFRGPGTLTLEDIELQ